MPVPIGSTGFYGAVVPAMGHKFVKLMNTSGDSSSKMYLHLTNVALSGTAGYAHLQIAYGAQNISVARLHNECLQHSLDIVVDGEVKLINMGPSPLHVSGYYSIVPHNPDAALQPASQRLRRASQPAIDSSVVASQPALLVPHGCSLQRAACLGDGDALTSTPWRII